MTTESILKLIAELDEKYPPLPPDPWYVSEAFMEAVRAKTLKAESPAAWNHIGGVRLIVDGRVPVGSRVPWYEGALGLLPVPLR